MIKNSINKIKKYFPFVLLVIGLAILALILPKTSPESFENEILECDNAIKESRFSCFRSSLEAHFKNDTKKLADYISANKNLIFEDEDRDFSYAIFGTNCHTFYHAVGDFIATHTKENSIKPLVNLIPSNCTNGYIMGLYKRFALRNNFDKELLKAYWKECPEGSANQCAHEIGHLLHDKYSYSVLKILDKISADEYSLKYPQSYKYSIFSNTDINKPFEECYEIVPDENKVAQCLTGIGHNLFLFSEFSSDGYKSLMKECKNADEENIENCLSFLLYRIGINHGAPKLLSGNFWEGEEVCKDAIQESGYQNLADHCYLGIGGGIGLYIDSEYANKEINDDNLPRTKEALTNYANLCNRIQKEYIDKCYAGLMGTKFAYYYKTLGLHSEKIEKLLPTLDSDFEVVQ